MTFQERKRFLHLSKYYFWDDPFLFRVCNDQIIRRCVPENEQEGILAFCHEMNCGGHFEGKKTMQKFYNQVSFGLLYLNMLITTV